MKFEISSRNFISKFMLRKFPTSKTPFFPGKFGRENNMHKLKEKNDQHLPKSSSYVNILQLVPDKLDESHPAPPGWVDGGNW